MNEASARALFRALFPHFSLYFSCRKWYNPETSRTVCSLLLSDSEAIRPRGGVQNEEIRDHVHRSIDKIDEWGVKEFAYEIDHMKKGYYVVINVTANNEGIQEFQRLARINNNIVRFMVVKTQGEE